MRVAVLGTGVMGAPMARNIARSGHEVHEDMAATVEAGRR